MALPPTFNEQTGQWSPSAGGSFGGNAMSGVYGPDGQPFQPMQNQPNLGFGGGYNPPAPSQSSYTPPAPAQATSTGYNAATIQGANAIAPQQVNLNQARANQGVLDPTQSMQRLLSGQIDNPYLQSMQQASVNTALRGYNDAMDSVTQNVLPQIRSGAVGAGQYGSSRQGIAEGLVGQQLGRNARDLGIASMDAGNQLYGTAYGQAQDRMYNTATGLNNQAFQASDNNANRDLSAQTSNASNQLAAQTFNANSANSARQFGAGAQNTASLANAGNTNQYNIAGMNNATTQRGQDQSYNLGQGNLALGNRSADQNYSLGQGNLALGNRQAANSYDLGLRNNDLGFGQLDANINQQNFNNQLSGANFGLSMYDRLNANNAAGINAATGIQNTPLNYYNQFSGLANQYGNAGGSTSSSTAMPGNPLIGGLAGYQMASNPNFRSSLGF